MANILVVEDEEDIRVLLNDDLTDRGHHVTTAPNGAAALELIERQKPDIVLLDVMMPVMHGYDLASILLGDRTTRNIPIVLITALDARDAQEQSKKIGVKYHISKPWDPWVLDLVLNVALREAESRPHAGQSEGSAHQPYQIYPPRGTINTQGNPKGLGESYIP